MDYYQNVHRALIYIEDNLTEEIDLGRVAEEAYCSLFYFHRVFSSLVGDSLKQYIRMRRMSEAARELVKTDRRLIDIALDYGFQSQESFTRTFRKHYNVTPARFRRKGHYFILRYPKSFEQLKKDSRIIKGECVPEIREINDFSVIGKQLITRMRGPDFKDIPLFWSEYREKEYFTLVPNRRVPERCYGICCPLNGERSRFAYLAAEEVSSTAEVPEGFVSRIIPGGTYAVFTSVGPVPETLQRVIQFAYGNWLPRSDRWERAGSEDFELYDQRMYAEVPVCEIYIPVKPK